MTAHLAKSSWCEVLRPGYKITSLVNRMSRNKTNIKMSTTFSIIYNTLIMLIVQLMICFGVSLTWLIGPFVNWRTLALIGSVSTYVSLTLKMKIVLGKCFLTILNVPQERFHL